MKSTQAEQWRPIPGYEGHYEVSDHGRVRSIDRKVSHAASGHITLKGRMLKPAKGKRGYFHVNLTKERRGKTFTVHRLVALAFIGEPPFAGADCCHWDDDKENNHVSNLRWGTRSDNVQDSIRNGTNERLNRTHCVNGHEFNEENTRYTKQGRVCIPCSRKRGREYAAANRKRGKGSRLRDTCSHGHKMEGDNVSYTKAGLRRCNTCAANKKK